MGLTTLPNTASIEEAIQVLGNQYLSIPVEHVKTLPDDIPRLLGYAACPSLTGFVEIDGVMCDPHVVLQHERVARGAMGSFSNDLETTNAAT